MKTSSPPMPLHSDLAGNRFSTSKAAPGDITNGLFKDLFRRLYDQDEGSELQNVHPWAELQSRLGSSTRWAGDSGGRNPLSVENSLSAIPADGFQRQPRFLDHLDILETLVLNRSDIPRAKEALFKMGLGADQVKDVMARAVNAEGHISLAGLTLALRSLFPDVLPETGPQLARILQREKGVSFRPSNLEQFAKDAGLNQALDRLTQGSSDAHREDARKEITTLMLSKGIPVEEIKKLIETLSIRREDSLGRQNELQVKNAALPKNQSHALRDESRAEIRAQDGRAERQQVTMQDRIIEILNREETLAGRKAGAGPWHGTENLKPPGVIEDPVSGPLKSNQSGINPSKTPTSEATHAREAVIQAGEVLKEASKSTLKGLRIFNADESGLQRQTPWGEASLSRADWAESSRQAASAARSQATPLPLPEPLPRIVDRMVWMVHRGEQTSRIQVSPPELGRLDLSIAIKQGHLHAHVSAENLMVKEIIEANLQQLKQQLINLGFTVERFDVSAGLDERRFAEFQARTKSGKRTRQERSDELQGPKAAGMGSDRPARNAAGELYRVNLRV